MAKDDLFYQLGDFISKRSRSLRDRLTLDVTDLLRAVDENDSSEVSRALNAGVNPNKDDGIGRIALPIAVDNNNVKIVALLLAAKTNPNLAGRDGQTALFKAVSWENTQIIELLLKAGADIHQPIKNGITPYEEARRKGYVAILKLLDQHYEQTRSHQVDQDKAKHEAMKAKAQKRLEAQAEEARQEEAAQKAKQLKEVKKRYELSDDNFLAALIRATREGAIADVQLLLKKVDQLNQIDPKSESTPLMAAILNKQTDITRLLIESGADCFQLVPKYHHSPLSYAVGQSYYKLVQLMLEKSKDAAKSLNADDQLLSPQFLAYKDPRMFHLLLEAGADPFFGGQEAPPPVIKAIEKASVAVLPVLKRHKVDLNRMAKGHTLLEWAIEFERQDWLIGLLKEGADMDIRDGDGQTALMHAVEARLPEFVAILLEENADPTLKNKEGKTAFDLAKSLEDGDDLVDLLESYG
ncbi:MAG: ankyrin repeat domain-containing protein [Bacteroidota bacterium]